MVYRSAGFDDLDGGHLVHGEGAGLVGVDGRREPQGLDRGQVLDHGVALRQLHAAAKDKMTWVTVGSASGMAAMASDTALTNRASQARPR